MIKRIGLMYGGKSGEHEVSAKSADSIRMFLTQAGFEVVDIFIDRENKFEQKLLESVEVVFPIVHGTYGEDGCLQGLLEMANMPYVGAGVIGSAIGMDKEVQKRLLNARGIPTAKYMVVDKKAKLPKVKYPVFVKPVNLGSSVGVSKCTNKAELISGVANALEYDRQAMIEEEVVGEEIEVSVLGNKDPQASLPGKLVATHEFYDYDAKYIDPNGAQFEVPAKIDAKLVKQVQQMAIKVYKVLKLEGMSRVDMFLTAEGKIVVNEANTLPGFTNISMYPKLWELSGLSNSELVKELISLALERHLEKEQLRRSFVSARR